MTKPATVTIPVTFEIQEFLDCFNLKGLRRRKFYEIARSAEFAEQMSKLLREDFFAMGGFDDMPEFFEDAFDPDVWDESALFDDQSPF
jgi:hypothetical protein